MYDTDYTAENHIIHTFDNGIVVLVDMNFKIAHVSFNGKKTGSFSVEDISLKEYYSILLNYGK